MARLPQTRQVLDRLRAAGFAHRDVRAYTVHGYTYVDFKCEREKQLRLAVPLSHVMKVTLVWNGKTGAIEGIQVDAFGLPQLVVHVGSLWIGHREVVVQSVEEAQACVDEANRQSARHYQKHQAYRRELGLDP